MKLLNREQFLKMPAGTIFAKGKPLYFHGLEIKFETTQYNDYWSLDPAWIDSNDLNEADKYFDEMLTKGASYPMDNGISRDGLFEEDAIFLVWEKNDLVLLKEYIENAIKLEG